MPRALLLDAMGTLVELEPPVEPLRRELRERFGVDVSAEEAGAALRAEIAFYRAHHDEGSDRAGLADLRERAAGVLRDALPPAAAALSLDALTEALLAALRFRPFAEVPEVLRAARERGVRLVVVSNWDVSLHEVLRETGLAPLLDGVVISAEVGSGKPSDSDLRARADGGGRRRGAGAARRRQRRARRRGRAGGRASSPCSSCATARRWTGRSHRGCARSRPCGRCSVS